jgi:spore germination protein GerM
VRVVSGVAVADFSAQLRSRFAGGADNEGVVVYAIVNTLASLPEVTRVRILVEGKPVESIGGHIDTSAPLRADHELVIPAPQSSAGGR